MNFGGFFGHNSNKKYKECYLVDFVMLKIIFLQSRKLMILG